jgi:hypothetical protein
MFASLRKTRVLTVPFRVASRFVSAAPTLMPFVCAAGM